MSKIRSRFATSRSFDIWELEEARYQFWLHNYVKCSKLIFPLCRKYVKEPLFNSKEYEDGERKQAESVQQPKEEIQTEEDFEWPLFLQKSVDQSGTEPERDNDGYLKHES